MATARESVDYAAMFTSHYLADARKLNGRAVPRPFKAIIVSLSATADTYKLTKIFANEKVVGLDVVTDGLGASAGVGSAKIGDSGDDDRYMAQTSFATANVHGVLAAAGAGYIPTADTDVVLTIVGGATAAKIVTGVLWVIPVA